MTILGRLLVKIKFKVVTLLLWMIQIKKWVCNFGLYCWRQSKPAQYSFAAPPLNLILQSNTQLHLQTANRHLPTAAAAAPRLECCPRAAWQQHRAPMVSPQRWPQNERKKRPSSQMRPDRRHPLAREDAQQLHDSLVWFLDSFSISFCFNFVYIFHGVCASRTFSLHVLTAACWLLFLYMDHQCLRIRFSFGETLRDRSIQR